LESSRYRAHRRSYANTIWVIAKTTLDAVTWRKESIEALNQIWMPSEEVGDAVNNTRGINTSEVSYCRLIRPLLL
jgi:hypothetical protein